MERELDLAKTAVELGLLNPDQLSDCLAEQSRAGAAGERPLSTILLERGYLTPDNLADLRRRVGGQTPASDAETVRVPSELLPTPSSPGLAPAPPLPADLPEEVRAAVRNPKNLFGKYVLVNPIGVGGFGTVYRAWQRDLTRWVAIKFLHSDDPSGIQRFIREAQTAAKLRHPNIVGIHEVSSIDTRLYIAMDYVEGRPLSRVRLDLKGAIRAVAQAARAVAYAHEKGVIHRDLKPSNILYEPGGRVCVMDFGLARHVSEGGTLTVSGDIVGTPAYMSPEQALAKQKGVTPLCDVYSLGATLYDVLAGQPPFEGSTPYEIIRKVIEQDPPAPRKIAPRLHPEIETIIVKAMDKNPAKRYATAAALADDLERHLKGEPILAKPVGPVSRVWKRIRRNPVVSAAIAVAVLGLVGGATFGIVLLLTRIEAQEREAKHLREENLRKDAAKETAQLVTAVERLRMRYYRPLPKKDRPRRDVRSLLPELEAKIREFQQNAPELPEPDYLLGRTYLEVEELDRAAESLQRAIAKDPAFSPARAAYARLLFERVLEVVYLGLVYPEAYDLVAPLQEEYRKQHQAAHRGRWSNLPGVETDRRLMDLLVDLKLPFESPAHAERLLADLERAWSETEDEEFLLYQAFPCVWLGGPRLDEGIEALTRAIEMRPGWARPYVYRTVLQASKAIVTNSFADFLKAEQDLQQARRIDPRNHLAVRNAAFKLAATRDYENAAAAYRRAIELRPQPLYYFERIETLKLLGRWDEAAKDADALVRLMPNFATALAVRSGARLGKGDLRGAEDDALAALQLRKDLFEPRRAMAEVQARKGRWKEALATAAEAQKDDPAPSVALRGLIEREHAAWLHQIADPRWRQVATQAQSDLSRFLASRGYWQMSLNPRCERALKELEALLKGP